MTYATDDLSIQSGKPIFFYEFVNGTETTRLTSSPSDVVFNALTWTASPVSHSTVTQSSEMAKDPIKIQLPRNDSFAAPFLAYVPDNTISVTIFRKHIDSADAVTYWKGRAAGFSCSEQIITIECESIFTSLRRAGLRALYQKHCRHILYGVGCNANKDTFEKTGVVSTVSANIMTVSLDAVGGVPDTTLALDGWYLGGMAKHDGIYRYIIGHVGSQITLSRPFQGAIATDVISLYPGCNRTRVTCASLFNNLNNFGGFPWIPGRNPFEGRI